MIVLNKTMKALDPIVIFGRSLYVLNRNIDVPELANVPTFNHRFLVPVLLPKTKGAEN